MKTNNLQPSGKSASHTQTERVRETVRHLVQTRYRGSQTDAARALGVAPTTVSTLLSGRTGPGLQLLEALRGITGRSLDDLLYGADLSQSPASGRFRAARVATAGDLPGWALAEQIARARHPDIPAWAWDAARDCPAAPWAEASADLATDLACLAWRHCSPDQRQRYEGPWLGRAAARLRAVPGGLD